MSGNFCACGKDTRDNRYVCDDCADEYARILGDCTWLNQQLGVTATRKKSPKASFGSSQSTEHALPFNEKAFEVHAYLKSALVRAARVCQELDLRGSDPSDASPEDTIESVSRWLLWRVDALCLTDWMPDLVRELIGIELDVLRVINNPPAKRFLGICTAEIDGLICGGPVFAGEDKALGKCRDCNADYDAKTSREGLLDALDSKLVTPKQIVEFTLCLGLSMSRKRITDLLGVRRKREPKLLPVQHDVNGEPMFRWSEWYNRLPNEERAS